MGRSDSKLTDEQREQIVLDYLGEGTPTMRELAAKYGVSQQTISATISNSKTLKRLEDRARANVTRALIRAQLNADEIMRMTIADAKKTREDKFGHLHQNARREVLDRAGVRIKEKEEETLTIRFAEGGGFEMGETQDVEVSE
jgi:DNA-directed RNA polymerase specialized sigma subunit